MAKAKPIPAPQLPSVATSPDRAPAEPPVFVARHRALKAAVWRNQSVNGDFFNVTVSRTYKDGDSWKESDSFGYDDVLHVAELLRMCHGFMQREMSKPSAKPKE